LKKMKISLSALIVAWASIRKVGIRDVKRARLKANLLRV
jgi:hypothetical protein